MTRTASMPRPIHACVLLALAWAALPGHAAPAAAAPPAASAAVPVTTRAIVRSIAHEDGELLIRLKLAPRLKRPFTTITYRVPDRRLVEGLREGDSVRFVAQRLDGANVLTAIERVPPCQRFQPCQ